MNEILSRLDAADDDTLEMSRMHCHGEFLHSIVLEERSDGSLLRCFLAEHRHSLWNNLTPLYWFALGVHDHKYDLTLRKVTGTAFNMLYEEHHEGQSINKYLFQSKINGGNGATSLGRARLMLQSVLPIENTFTPRNALHTVFVNPAQQASWIVEEGPRLSDTSTLYTNSKIDVDCLYNKFASADHVRKFVNKFFQ